MRGRRRGQPALRRRATETIERRNEPQAGPKPGRVPPGKSPKAPPGTDYGHGKRRRRGHRER